MHNFEFINSAVAAGIIPIKKYRSKATGFTICIANVDGPLVNGYMCLATEAHDDDGLPHTLEHLIFMGSEDYPYKGMLDLFANRCLAQGTNAWTATDHTCYTMTTAGSEGFLNLLPIYLDHILYPTVTESAYITEVHHVNGEGEDAGVVYCEMQARENSGYSRTFLEFLRSMYPGHCGYKSETGGIMKNLRESCSHKKVSDYHSEFYRPENLCLIITGNVNAEDVFRVVQPFEEKIESKGGLPPHVRPWMNELPPLGNAEEKKHIIFATEDETTGMVLVGWRGPNVLDHYDVTAVKILLSYLTDTSVAPLQKDLVEIEEPLCGDICGQLFENKETALCLFADNVLKENLFEIKDRVLDVLNNISMRNVALDMDRLNTLIHRAILEEMNELEDSPHDALASLTIVDFLYSANKTDLQDCVGKIKHLERLKTEKDEFWLKLLKQYIISQKLVVIIGDPSEDFMKKMGEEEKQRVEKQAACLGEKGLKEKSLCLENALSQNNIEAPKNLFKNLSVPSTDSITLHQISCASNVLKNDDFEHMKKFQLDEFPCPFYVYHVKSLFTQLYMIIDTASLSKDSRMYLPLYSEIILESPILKEGKLIPYEDVVKQLAADTLSASTSIGVEGRRFTPGSFASLLVISFKVENEKYEKAVEWLKDILFGVKFSPDRLKVTANKIINDVASHKRDGKKAAAVLLHNINFTEGSNFYISNMIRQNVFLTQLVKDLDSCPDKVIADMNLLRKELLCCEKMRCYVAANLSNLPQDAHSVWIDVLFKQMDAVKSLDRTEPVPRDGHYLSNKRLHKIVGVGSVESAFLMQTCQGIDTYEHPDYPAMLVFIQYLCALEGPLWRQIRGSGLSYNYRVNVSPNTGKIYFVLAKSTHIFEAYKKAKEIMEDFISGKTAFQHDQVEAAISGAIFQEIEAENTISDAITQNIVSAFKKVPSDFCRTLLRDLKLVTAEDLVRVGSTYFSLLFNPNETSAALCCHPTKVSEIKDSFDRIDVKFKVVSTLEEEF